jgi:hypothetical protein
MNNQNKKVIRSPNNSYVMVFKDIQSVITGIPVSS